MGVSALIELSSSYDWAGLFVFSTCLVLLFVIFAVIGSHFAFSLVSDNEYSLSVARETSSVRFFRLDLAHQEVTYFNLSSLRNVRHATVKDFIASFPSAGRERLGAWIDELASGRPTPDYLELDVYIGKRGKRQLVPSFLKMTDVDLPKGIIHLESYLLSALGPSSPTLGFRLSTEDEFAEALKSNGPGRGFTFCFSFYPQKNRASKTKVRFSKELSSRFRGLVAPYVKGNQRLLPCSESEFVLANFDMAERSEAIDFALRARKGIETLLITTRKKKEPLFECRIGIVVNRDLAGDSDAIIAESRSSAELARANDVGFEFYSRERASLTREDEVGIFKNEVERIIDSKKISIAYRPVYSVTRRFVYAYLSEAKPVNTSFANIDELKNYARRAKDDKNLFAHVAKQTISRFVNERELKSQKLVFPVRYDELPLIQSFFPRYRTAKEANLSFLFKEDDCVQNIGPGRIDDFVLALTNLKERDFQIAFSLSGNGLLLDQKALALSDAFYVDFSSTGGSHMDTRVRSQLHALVEKLLKFKKPIVASNLPTWTSLELVVGSGIDYISCDCFAGYDINLRPVNPKNIQRIQNLRERK